MKNFRVWQNFLLLFVLLFSVSYVTTQTCATNINFDSAKILTLPNDEDTTNTECVVAADSFPPGVTLPPEVNVTDQNLLWFAVEQQTEIPIYNLNIETCSSTFDTVLFVFFVNVSSGYINFVDYNDDGCFPQSTLSVVVSNDVSVIFAAGGYNSSSTGDLTISISSDSLVSDSARLINIATDLESILTELNSLKTQTQTSVTSVENELTSLQGDLTEVSSELESKRTEIQASLI